MTHPSDRLEELGFRRTPYDEWKGRRPFDGKRVTLSVDHVNQGPDYADEEEFWEATVTKDLDFETVTDSLGLYSSRLDAIGALVLFVEGYRR